VTGLYAAGGQDVQTLDPLNTDTRIVLTYGAHKLLAIYDAPMALVAFDLQVETCPNRLQVGSREIVRAAILGTPQFDVRAIDPASVRLLGVPPLQSYIADVGSPKGRLVGKTNINCVGGARDRIDDLLLTFPADEVSRAIEARIGRPLASGETIALTVTGTLRPEYGKRRITGEDLTVIHRGNSGSRPR